VYSPPDFNAVISVVGTLKSVPTGDVTSSLSLHAVTDDVHKSIEAISHKIFFSFTIVGFSGCIVFINLVVGRASLVCNFFNNNKCIFFFFGGDALGATLQLSFAYF
jgi:hypothetical protein